MEPLRVMIVDDSSVYRRTLRVALEAVTPARVVAEAAEVAEALRVSRAVAVDLVFMDMSLPDVDGFSGTRLLLEEHPSLVVVMASAQEHESYRRMALAAGAMAFHGKSTLVGELENLMACVEKARRARGDAGEGRDRSWRQQPAGSKTK